MRFALLARAPLLLAAVACGALAARANRENPRARLSWWWVAAGFAVLLPGDIAFAIETAGGEDPPASVADAFYLSYFVLILGGLLSFPRVFRNRGDAAMFALDAGIVAIGGGMVLWHFGVQPVFDAAEGEITPTLLLDLAYPLGDLLTLLGIAQAGAAYVPIDPAHSAARMELVLTDATPVAVITTAAIPGHFKRRVAAKISPPWVHR